MTKGEIAKNNFMQGYNCAQAVFAAYADLFGFDRETALKISASFGAGMGRMREVCGTVSAMFMIAGMVSGCTTADDREGKKANYDMVQKLAEAFREKNGSIYCKVLLGLVSENDVVKPFNNTTPDKRTAEYYKKRPCGQLVMLAATILEDYIKEHPTDR